MGGGGGGGGSYIPPSSDALARKVQEAWDKERERLNSDVDKFLQDLLSAYNNRDAERVQRYLQDLAAELGESLEVDQLLFGGSVAKHTYVDGLSDIDALVALDKPSLVGKSPAALLTEFHRILNDALGRDRVQEIHKGSLAVTVTYRDGTEIQLLPALRSGNRILISDSSGKGWKETNPRRFQRELTKENQRLGGSLVPTIKLMKSLVSVLPEGRRITGYHVESLSLDAARAYSGATNARSLLLHVLDHSAGRVLKPIRDVTGQSRTVDSDLGPAKSLQRQAIAQALASAKRRLESATTLSQWRAIFED